MKNNSKTDRRRLLNLSMRVVVALVMVGLLVVPIAVQADLKATAVVYAWDIVANKFQNSNVIIPWDGSWVPFLHELNFDTDNWADSSVCGYDPTNPDTTGTRWAGNMYYGLYYVDDAPLGAPGFQESRLWSLISCDRNGDGSFNNGDLVAPPPPNDRGEWRGLQNPQLPEPWGPYAECNSAGDYCYVDEANDQDVPTYCTTGNCLAEIVTTIQVNLDLDCDGAVDQELLDMGLTVDGNGHPEMLCFYAEARTPNESSYLVQPVLPDPPPDPPLPAPPMPSWSGPLQARISTVGGDKTVNFALDPTAVELVSFDAAPQGNGVLLNWETATETDNVGFNVYRAETQSGQLIKINPYLIAAQNPGSTAGAAYSFLDESAVPGATYYYWLEDIDAAGVATRQGPAVAKMDAAKALPGRPRPAPMPENAF
jgi:hypothetical protein